MSDAKTRPTDQSVEAFLSSVEDPAKLADCRQLVSIMSKVTKSSPVLWGDSLVGFGVYHYRYASGHEGDWPLTAFAPRKQGLAIYLNCSLESEGELLQRLGKFKHGKSCLNVRSLEDIDLKVLAQLIRNSVRSLKKQYGS
ncbi:MAG: DUF1801 domain-containing protein [Pirellulaceae bacterium]|jgi:hypothetical protein